jgi:F-type H+-transporting ATPase subunit delta
MAELLEHQVPSPLPSIVEVDEAAARRTLRAQIARLEGELAAATATAWPRTDLRWTVAASGGPRLLTLGDLEALRDALHNPELRAVAQHPAIPYATKERVLRAVAGTQIDAEPLNLVLLMIRRGRPGAIESMVDHFKELLRRERGISRAEVRSAMPLDEEQRTALTGRLRELTSTKIELSELVDESLIGGVAVRIGDTLYDASVRSRLERLRARLTAV